MDVILEGFWFVGTRFGLDDFGHVCVVLRVSFPSASPTHSSFSDLRTELAVPPLGHHFGAVFERHPRRAVSFEFRCLWSVCEREEKK